MAVRGQGLADDEVGEGASAAAEAEQRIVYVLHPNCAVEEF